MNMGFLGLFKDSGDNPPIGGDFSLTVRTSPLNFPSPFKTGMVFMTEGTPVNVHHSIGLSRVEVGVNRFPPDQWSSADRAISVGVFFTEAFIGSRTLLLPFFKERNN